MSLGANGKTVYQIIEEEFSCDHSQTEIRYKVDRLKRRQYVRQCLACGAATTSALSYSDVPNKGQIHPFDEELREAFWTLKRERGAELRIAHGKEWWGDYSSYLNSPEWRSKRKQVLERDNYLCQSCRERTANQVHHLPGAYKYIPNEPLFMLVAICDECHDLITATDHSSTTRRDDERKQIA